MRLIDADALKKYMDDCGWCDNCPDKKRLCEMDCRFPDFCTHEWQRVIDEQPTIPASPWHRVEDELPDNTRDVLAVRRYGNDLEKQEVIVAHISVIMDMKRGFDKWWNATNITHWMPFPEPPKEDA